MRRIAGVMPFMVVLLLMAGGAAQAQLLRNFERSQATVETASGAQVFAVEIARTPEQRAQGLMFRRALAADAGMLFLFHDQAPRSFWMRNTLIPLDIIYIDRTGRVVSIAQRTVPLSLAPIPSGGPASAVLEVNAGTAKRLGISPGDRVIHPEIGR